MEQTKKPPPPALALGPKQATKSQQSEDWHLKSAEAVLDSFDVRPDSGLDQATADTLLLEHGPNELVDKGIKNPFLIIWDQLADPLVLLLIGAAIVSGLLNEWNSTIAISAIVLLNAAIGFSQEYRAEQAINALKKMSAPTVRVRRGSRVEEVSPEHLVPGDIVLVEAGSIVPADARVFAAASLQALEASLTGESVPVEKKTGKLNGSNIPIGDRVNMIFMGTSISHGRGEAIVVNTGMDTQLGRIATLIQEVETEKTPLQRRLDEVGKALFILAIAIIAVAFLLGLLRPNPNIAELAVAAVAIAVAVVPEGLPAVVTIALALGAQRMLKKNALIRKLPAVETLGSVTVICTDKTGTLTENKMTVKVIDTAGRTDDIIEMTRRSSHRLFSKSGLIPLDIGNASQRILLMGGALASDAVLQKDEGDFTAVGDPTEGAIVVAAAHFGIWKSDLEEYYPRVAEAPFESDRKRMSTVHELNGHGDLRSLIETPTDDKFIVFAKGAVDSLLTVCDRVYTDKGIVDLSDEWHERVLEMNDSLAKDGLRVLGVAYRTTDDVPKSEESIERNLIFVGMLGLIDPPRQEVKEAVRVAKQAGIRPVMITGDHPLTAQYIAKDLGIARNDKVRTGTDLAEMDEGDLLEAVMEVDVFARVSPEHKLRIVEAMQKNNQIAAMTGDGVNDAPALRKADIGVAMGITGTDVSKEASDMVILDDNFATIVDAAEEGRTIYSNVRKFIMYILGSNTGEVFVLLGTQALVLPLPLSTIQILYMNLVTDGLPALALAVEKGEDDAMIRRPFEPGESIFARGLWQHLVFVGILIFAVGFGTSAIGFSRLDRDVWSTMVFSTLILSQMGHALSVRSEKEMIFSKGTFQNTALMISVLGTIALQFVMIYVPLFNRWFETAPLKPGQLGICVGLSILVAILIDLRKWITNRRRGKN